MTTEELPMQPGRVPVGELRALVEEWRAQEYGYVNEKRLHAGCATDLETLIGEYEPK